MDKVSIESLSGLFSFGRIAVAMLVLLLAWAVARTAHRLAGVLAQRFARYRTQIAGLAPVAAIAIWATALYVVIAGVFQPPAASLLAMLASIGLAVGLASQDILKNFIAGLIILFERPIRSGDMISVGGHYGEVVGLGMRSVQVHTFDDSIVTVPNSTIISESVSNANNGARDEMVVIRFTVPASVDVVQLKSLATDAAACSPYAYLRKPIAVFFEDDFNRTFLTKVTIKAYVLDVRYERLFASDVIERVKRALLERGLLSKELVLSALRAEDA
jgi:small-conductance mechanosensitive channel